ncbi:RHS repeat domain-containing protein [Ottowia testudinis]|uniref:RHS domain-containing protein n=1 Tax=Ottowia testudinis TaxID=2816950 RepID=A0A975CIE4_9BURK|nr:RHS repeat-associated core domain-containing protein [Ottowia testudinis]QTD46386.1 RHS domain-containing protein [Ottowia testudinis]
MSTKASSLTASCQPKLVRRQQGHAEQETGSNWQRTYRYDAAERLSQISTSNSAGPSASVSYRYDPFGRRIAKTVGQSANSTSTYYLNGDSALMAEANDEGKLTKAYGFNPNTQAEELDLWSTDPIWQAELNGKTNLSEASYHYIATDHLGTPMLATNQQGAKTWRSYQEAFGQTYTENSGLELNLRFPGQYWDKETNLHQNYFRDYSPQRGRYIQADPIGLWGGLNLFTYVRGSAVISFDPLGLMEVRARKLPSGDSKGEYRYYFDFGCGPGCVEGKQIFDYFGGQISTWLSRVNKVQKKTRSSAGLFDVESYGDRYECSKYEKILERSFRKLGYTPGALGSGSGLNESQAREVMRILGEEMPDIIRKKYKWNTIIDRATESAPPSLAGIAG